MMSIEVDTNIYTHYAAIKNKFCDDLTVFLQPQLDTISDYPGEYVLYVAADSDRTDDTQTLDIFDNLGMIIGFRVI